MPILRLNFTAADVDALRRKGGRFAGYSHSAVRKELYRERILQETVKLDEVKTVEVLRERIRDITETMLEVMR